MEEEEAGTDEEEEAGTDEEKEAGTDEAEEAGTDEEVEAGTDEEVEAGTDEDKIGSGGKQHEVRDEVDDREMTVEESHVGSRHGELPT